MDYNKIYYESEQLDEALNKKVGAAILALGLTVAPMFAKSAKKNKIPPETILTKIEKQFDGKHQKVISAKDYRKARKIYYDSIGSQPDFLNDEFKETLLNLGFVVDDEDGYTILGNNFEKAWHSANYTEPTPINFDESIKPNSKKRFIESISFLDKEDLEELENKISESPMEAADEIEELIGKYDLPVESHSKLIDKVREIIFDYCPAPEIAVSKIDYEFFKAYYSLSESKLQEMDFRYKAKVDRKWLKGRSLTDHKEDASEFETESEPTQIINQLKRDGKVPQKAKIKIVKRRE